MRGHAQIFFLDGMYLSDIKTSAPDVAVGHETENGVGALPLWIGLEMGDGELGHGVDAGTKLSRGHEAVQMVHDLFPRLIVGLREPREGLRVRDKACSG